MRLLAAVMPPAEVQSGLSAIVTGVPGTAQQLDVVEPRRIHLRLAALGNVTRADAEQIRQTLASQLKGHGAVHLRFAGGTACEPIGDDSVWATLDGDVERVGALASSVVSASKRLGFAVDRRISRQHVRLARVTPTTSVDGLQSVLDALEAHTGPWWECSEVALLRLAEDVSGPVPDVEVWGTVPLT